MDLVGLPIASSIAGASQAERQASRDAQKVEEKRPARRFRRLGDDAELNVTPTESVEAVRDAKGNDQEESHEDRQEHSAAYDAQGHTTRETRPHLDVEG